ncbi:hypothetical protein imdm_1487 [gamma proteobacterium IMCC2047]|nr:hypothetical protein imdm_1487 [gamma proteobacterium IMCC2047]
MLNVLIVEDDKDLASSVIDHLEIDGVTCDYASNGVEGYSLIDRNNYQVIVMDINMQEMDGLTLCQKIRARGNDTPVLMLTARNTLTNKVEGFSAGADDYLLKPFEVEELLLRLYALSGRRSGQASLLKTGNLSLNLNNRTGTINDEPIKLTPTTFKLLETLLRASPNPVSQSELVQRIWGDDIPDSNKLRVHIHKLRNALREKNAEHLLKTAPGFGFYIAC